MSISSKEARETKYWLRLLKESELTNLDVNSLILDIDEFILNFNLDCENISTKPN